MPGRYLTPRPRAANLIWLARKIKDPRPKGRGISASTTQRTVVPGATFSPIGSKPTCAPSGSLRSSTSTTAGAARVRRSAGAASRSPQPASNRRLSILLQLRLVLGHVPEDDVVVRLLHAGVAGVVVHRDLLDRLVGPDCELVELLLRLHVLERDHVDR